MPPRSWVRLLFACALVALVLPLTACWVYSVYGIAEDEKLQTTDALLPGNWIQEGEGGCVMVIAKAATGASYRVSYQGPGSGCLVDGGATFEGRLTAIGGHRFLDLFPNDRPDLHHQLQMHSICKVAVSEGVLTVTFPDEEWVKGQMESNALPVKATRRGHEEDVVFTSSGDEMREFLRLNGNNVGLFNPEKSLKFKRF